MIDKERIQELAIACIGVVDYDIEKECVDQLNEDGHSELVDEMIYFLQGLIEEFQNR